MVTYGIATVFAIIGATAAYSAPGWGKLIALVWLGCAVGLVIHERRSKAAQAKFDAEQAERDAEHEALMSKLDAQTKRWREETEALVREAADARAKWMAEHWVVQVVLVRAECLPMNEERAAAIRQEFMVLADSVIANIH